ncbi:hypothetical protein ABZ876_24400 [Streptomyces sp. NPDC046931]|uniref:hypothetical protein n=1 Tax=Streptomyces sp. NPDC046931 TaxID=3154806 RepID=UPI0034067B34
MHRTTTTATLLVSVAVSALTGCVTVQRPPAPLAPRAPSQSSAPRADGSVEPRVVQAPAREALEMVGPSRLASAPDTARRGTPRPVPVRTAAPHRRPAPAQPGRDRPGQRGEVPPAVPEGLSRNPDVCALGRRYGGWRPGSPEADLCGSTYGR